MRNKCVICNRAKNTLITESYKGVQALTCIPCSVRYETALKSEKKQIEEWVVNKVGKEK